MKPVYFQTAWQLPTEVYQLRFNFKLMKFQEVKLDYTVNAGIVEKLAPNYTAIFYNSL